jgi:uncharacterized protein YjcR
MADWQKIKTEYITTDTSYRKLAQKYGVNPTTIAKRASKEGWQLERKHQASKTLSKVLAVDSKKKADRLTRIQDATDRLLDKIEQAIDELNIQLAKNTHKEKVIEYNNPDRHDKPTKEIIHETEEIIELTSIVDRQGLKHIAAALKDIKDVQMLKSELDRREQEARIKNLQRQAEKDDGKDTGYHGVVLLPVVADMPKPPEDDNDG